MQELRAKKVVADEASGAASELASQLKLARSEQSEARTDLSLERGEVKKLRKVRETLEAALAQAKTDSSSCEDLRAELQRWRDACIEATERVKGSIRILVTSPKVSINIGQTESVVQKAIARDIEKIRGALSEKVLPCFQKVMAVDEDLGDGAVKRAVTQIVEDLAAAVQQEVYKALPMAEGTTSWDGFGSRLTALK